jgi:hypothetical protein
LILREEYKGAEENIWTEERWREEAGENCIKRSFITCILRKV